MTQSLDAIAHGIAHAEPAEEPIVRVTAAMVDGASVPTVVVGMSVPTGVCLGFVMTMMTIVGFREL